MFQDIKIVRLSGAVAAGQTAIEGAAVSREGYDGVLFLVSFGAITAGAVTSVKLQSCSASDGSNPSDLEGTLMTIGDDQDSKIAVIDVVQPRAEHVWLRPYVSRGTQNAAVDAIIAILYRGRVKPAVLDATVMAVSKIVSAPDNGTA